MAARLISLDFRSWRSVGRERGVVVVRTWLYYNSFFIFYSNLERVAKVKEVAALLDLLNDHVLPHRLLQVGNPRKWLELHPRSTA